ncbi:hypothetical protein BDV95DRAFT_572431 [Massariosphaeria phaeospora]|uniref:Uncharacterized protein n=1 Tax=Massariosphaeria phaeospora TaxID=100035 RepID=A0A7C8MP21_9PLEO|nr:hypothetical protein BDV95DRAFT_572431 [Massariosphaeria phaeospora]
MLSISISTTQTYTHTSTNMKTSSIILTAAVALLTPSTLAVPTTHPRRQQQPAVPTADVAIINNSNPAAIKTGTATIKCDNLFRQVTVLYQLTPVALGRSIIGTDAEMTRAPAGAIVHFRSRGITDDFELGNGVELLSFSVIPGGENVAQTLDRFTMACEVPGRAANVARQVDPLGEGYPLPEDERYSYCEGKLDCEYFGDCPEYEGCPDFWE